MSATDGAAVLYVDADEERRSAGRAALADRLDDVAVRAVASLDPDSLSEDCVAVVACGGEEAAAVLVAVAEHRPTATTLLLTDDEACSRRAEASGVEVVPGTGPAALRAAARRVASAGEAGGASAAHLRQLVETTEDAILTIDTGSTIRYANPAVEPMFGYDPEELVGESLTVLMDETDAERHRAGLRRYLQTGERSLEWTDVELVGRHRDGHEVPLSASFTSYCVDGERYFTGVLRDVTERHAVAARLAHHEAMVRTVGDGIYALDEEGRFLVVNDAYIDLVGYDRSELLGTRAADVIGVHDSAAAARLQRELAANDEDAATLETTITCADGTEVPVETRISLFPMEDGSVGRVGVVRDITERKRREERLAALNEVAQRLTHVEAREAAAEVVVEAAVETLGFPLASVELYDDEAGTLRTAARVDRTGEGRLFPERGLPWRVYAEQEGQLYESLAADDDPETSLGSVVVLPIGGHGVFVAGSDEAGAVGETEQVLAELLAADVEATLDRVDRERELRDQKRRAEERNEALERLERLNGVIRNITRSLTRAMSREEVERAVCENLTSEGPYGYCFVAERASVGGSGLTVRATAGDGGGYLDAVSLTVDGDEADPTGRAVASGEPQVWRTLDTDPPFEAWRAAAVERGFRSCAAVPLAHGDTLYGVLTVYADRPGLLDDREVAVLAELGEMVAYAINAMEREKLLGADAAVALRFELGNTDLRAVQFTRETGGAFEFEEFVRRPDGDFRVFFTVSGADPEQVFEFVRATPGLSDATLIAEGEGATRFEVTTTESGFLGGLVSAGAYPKAMSATGESAEVTVELPRSGDIRSFIQTFLDAHDADLIARVERDRPVLPPQEFGTAYQDLLTERQREVMETAYFAGYFEWPRETSGQELADMLGVSQPTVTRHLRNGERRLLGLVFDDVGG